MTVILVLVTFLVLIVVDYVLNRRKAISTVAAMPRELPRRRRVPIMLTDSRFPRKSPITPAMRGLCMSARM